MKVLYARYRDKTQAVIFGGRTQVREFKPGDNKHEGEIAGLEMSLNPNTGLVSIDVPGDSIIEHVSALQLRVEPVITKRETFASLSAQDVSDINKGAAAKILPKPGKPLEGKKAEALGYDTGDDLDGDVKRFMKPSKPSAPPKVKVASSTVRVKPKPAPEGDDE